MEDEARKKMIRIVMDIQISRMHKIGEIFNRQQVERIADGLLAAGVKLPDEEELI